METWYSTMNLRITAVRRSFFAFLLSIAVVSSGIAAGPRYTERVVPAKKRQAKKAVGRYPTQKVVYEESHDAVAPAVGLQSCSDCQPGSPCGSCTTGHSYGGCAMATCGTNCGCISIYGNVEYMLWWDNATELPVLVNSSPAGTDPSNVGVVGFSTPLIGGSDLDDDSIFGYRFTLGTWLGNGTTALVGQYFTTDEQDVNFQTDSIANPLLGKPFFDVLNDTESSVRLGLTDEFTGSVNVDWRTETSGYGVHLRQLYRCQHNYRLDFIYGYRQLSMDETLTINSSQTDIDPGSLFNGTQTDQNDFFDVENEFHGFDFGIMGHSVDGAMTLDFVAKVALGTVNHEVTIDGSSVATPAVGAPTTITGGLLTQTSNIGTYELDEFAVVPEFTATLGYQVTDCVDFTVGYTFLYINRVARASSVVDRSVNLSRTTGVLTGEARPSPEIHDVEYWLQGVNFGLNFRF